MKIWFEKKCDDTNVMTQITTQTEHCCTGTPHGQSCPLTCIPGVPALTQAKNGVDGGCGRKWGQDSKRKYTLSHGREKKFTKI